MNTFANAPANLCSFFTVAFLLSCIFQVQAQSFDLTPEHWQVIDNGDGQTLDLKVIEYKGKKAIHLGSHQIASLKGQSFDNFILEMDVAGKAMPGIGFHADGFWDYEFVYARVFAGGKKDAIQYVPIFNGAMGWQLYNDPYYEVAADVQPEEWFHVKLEVSNGKMRLYLNESKQATLAIDLLGKPNDANQFFLKTSFSDGYFANVNIRALDTKIPTQAPKAPEGILQDWMISPQTEGTITSQSQYYQLIEQLEKGEEWQSIKADQNGLVNLAKYFDHPQESALAKTVINSSTEKEVTLAYDFSQVMMVVLNDQVLEYRVNLDSEDFMRIYPDSYQLKLPLQKGENKLVFWIRSDDQWQAMNPPYLDRRQAMNWGFIARIVENE